MSIKIWPSDDAAKEHLRNLKEDDHYNKKVRKRFVTIFHKYYSRPDYFGELAACLRYFIQHYIKSFDFVACDIPYLGLPQNVHVRSPTIFLLFEARGDTIGHFMIGVRLSNLLPFRLYDSFGRYRTNSGVELKPKWFENSTARQVVQHPDSSTCSAWCLYFILRYAATRHDHRLKHRIPSRVKRVTYSGYEGDIFNLPEIDLAKLEKNEIALFEFLASHYHISK